MVAVKLVSALQDFWIGHRLVKRGETFRADHEIPASKPKLFGPYREPAETAIARHGRR